MKGSRIIFFMSFYCLISVTFLWADDSISADFNIDEIEVVARVSEKDVIQPQRLSGKALVSLNALSVADAIRYFAGVQIKDYGGVAGIKTVNVRSMGTHHIGVYYNGVQVGNAQNGQVDLGKFSLENIESVELYNGQKSDIFQSAKEFGSAGSIYLTTRRPKFRNGEVFHVRGQMRTGSFGLINPSLVADIRISEKVSCSVNAELVEASGKYNFRYRRRIYETGSIAYDTSAVRCNGDVHAIRVEGTVNHYYSNSGFWKLLLYHYSSERGVPGAIVNSVFKNGERLWDRNSFGQFSWQDEFFRRWAIKINAKYAHDYTRYINYDSAHIKGGNEFLQRELYFSLANKVVLFRWWDMSLSYDMQWNGLTKHMEASRFTHWLSFATAFNFRDYVRLQTSVLGTFVNEEKRERDKAPDKQKCTAGVFVSYRPFRKVDWHVNAFYKQSYRYPTFNDLYYTEMGYANLRPEQGTQYDIGMVYNFPFKLTNIPGSSLNLSVDGYYNYVTDKIIAYPKGQQFRWTMLNLGKVDIRGIDAVASLTLACPKDVLLTLKMQYTYQRAIDVTSEKETFYKHQIPYIPHHSGSVVGLIQWRNYSLNYSFIYVGERYDAQENISYNYMQPWYTHDVSISGEWNIFKKRKNNFDTARPCLLRVVMDVNNLLSQDYEIIRNYPMPKTNFKCTVSITY